MNALNAKSWVLICQHTLRWKLHMRDRAHTFFAFQIKIGAVGFYHRFCNGQAKAGALRGLICDPF